MLGEVGRLRVVEEVVEGRDYGVSEDVGEGEFLGSIEGSIDADCNICSEKREEDNEDEGEWPGQQVRRGAWRG